MNRVIDKSWNKIFDVFDIHKNDFDKEPFIITSKMIKEACQDFNTTGAKEVRILCKQDSRDKRPYIFIKKELFLLPIKNGTYAIIKGEGYVDIPEINKTTKIYSSKLGFHLDSSTIGNSEMQHLDFAYASSLIRTFLKDNSLVLTIRGRKYTPEFSFFVGTHRVTAKSVQTEVDAGYEGKNQIVLIEAKNSTTTNTIIRQLFYPLKQWEQCTEKIIKTVFFEKSDNIYSLWLFEFDDKNDYNSIKCIRKEKYEIKE